MTFAGWDLPYEEQPEQPLAGPDPLMVGSIVVMGAVIPSPLGRFPVVVFRFEDAQRVMLPPLALVLDETRMRRVPGLVESAVASAIRQARGATGG